MEEPPLRLINNIAVHSQQSWISAGERMRMHGYCLFSVNADEEPQIYNKLSADTVNRQNQPLR